jgi:hypothetical protein
MRNVHIRRDPGATPGKPALVLEIETDDPILWSMTPQPRADS